MNVDVNVTLSGLADPAYPADPLSDSLTLWILRGYIVMAHMYGRYTSTFAMSVIIYLIIHII